jgi:PUA domain protein
LNTVLPSLSSNSFREHRIEVASLETDRDLYLIDAKPAFLKTEKGIFPTLVNRDILESVPTITVDAGTIPHLCNGSALMAPGIVKTEGRFSKDEIVAVEEVRHGKTIAIVKTLIDSDEMKITKKGKVATNIHYVGDKYWNTYKNLT